MSLEELNKEQELLFKLNGQDHYTIEVLKAQMNQRNQRILELNKKAHELSNPPPAVKLEAVTPPERC